MLNRYNITMGFYEPSLFHLHIRGKGNLRDIKSWDVSQKSTFLHEYIHFLQDITTIQGFNNFFVLGEYFRYVSRKVEQSIAKEIYVPVNPLLADKNVDQNWKVSENIFGTDEPVECVMSYYPKHVLDLVDYNDGKRIPLNVVKLNCFDSWGNSKEVTFGTLHILEGMAKLIEELVYPCYVRTSPYNPYYIACDVAEMIIPGIRFAPFTLIALFDYALQTMNPGWNFIGYLESKQRNGYDAKSLTPEIVYADMENYIMNVPSLGQLKFAESYEVFQGGAEDVMNEYLGGIWYLKNIENWYKKILLRSRELRFKHFHFFQELAEGGDILENNLFQELWKMFGTPLTTNGDYCFDFISPKNVFITKEELINVYAMMQIHQVFLSNGVYTCPIRKFCQKKRCALFVQKVDKQCVKQPWERESKCYFSIWWKFKGFDDIEIVPSAK